MRSIPVTMTWEMLTHGRWTLIAFALAANLLPAILLAALRHDGALEPGEPPMLGMQIVMLQVNMFIFGCAVFDAQGQPTRLFAMPITTTSLVAWQMLPAMALVFVETLASTALLNAAFNLNWPLWGPALCAAVGVAAIQAALWSAGKSAWLPLAVVVPGTILGLWFKSRFGPMFSQPTHQWSTITPGEVISLFAFAGLAHYGAVIGVALRRCGEPLPSLGIITWIERALDPPLEVGPPFVSAAHAHFWAEWRKKGWVMPGIVIFGMLIGVSIWVLFVREWQDLFEGFVAGGAMLTLMGFTGFVIGNVGPDDKTFDMGQFLATRPLTTTEMSRTILKVIAKSVLIAWSIWAMPFVILIATFSARQAMPHVELLNDFGWWFFPLTLLGCWTMHALFAFVGLTGRSTAMAQAVCVLFAVSIGLALFSKFALPMNARPTFHRGIALVVGASIALGTVWAFVAARRRALVGSLSVAAGAGVWMVLCGLIVFDWVLHARPWLPSMLAACTAALVVAPLAAAPLALTWNRNR